ncbi:Ubiquitin-like protein [Neonectria punicea]|uniref:Ubiquitin-like protein ATG12 n=1 Tax=Neonectria punicea TaxID=979145 RepID=A0ABR1H2F0_9HYPO
MSDHPLSHESLPSSPSPPTADADDGTPDRAASPDLPLTMSASVVLADLPRDASAALATAGAFPVDKVVIRFKPVGSAPGLTQDVCKISAARKFEEVVRYLRRKLRCRDSDSVFLYVNSAFAPSLDEVVGNLHQCFKNAQDQLIVAYSLTPAFG